MLGFKITAIDIPSKHCPNGRGKVPFVECRDFIYHIPFKNYMPRNYIYNKKLWELKSGDGSTYYIPSKIQILPILDDGPFELQNIQQDTNRNVKKNRYKRY